jgi:putative hydrolase of the HAD superfamily
MSIKAVIWDFGGVLTTSPFDSFNRFEAERGIPADFIRGINATNPDTNAWAQFESSAIGIKEFDAKFADETAAKGHRISGKRVVDLLSGDLRPRMVETLKRCKAELQVACITNNLKSGKGPGMATDADRARQMDEVMALFDLVVESSLEGMRKPNPKIYQLTCSRMNIEPSEAVFLDDLGVNLKPARALGMQTIKVIDESQAIADLAHITGLDL